MKKYLLIFALFLFPSYTNAGMSIQYSDKNEGLISSYCTGNAPRWQEYRLLKPWYQLRAYYDDDDSFAGKNDSSVSGCLPLETFDEDRQFTVFLSEGVKWETAPDHGISGYFSGVDPCTDDISGSDCWDRIKGWWNEPLASLKYDGGSVGALPSGAYNTAGIGVLVSDFSLPAFAFPVFYVALGGALMSMLVYFVVKYKA